MNPTEMNNLTMECPNGEENLTNTENYSDGYCKMVDKLSDKQSKQPEDFSEARFPFSDREVSSIYPNQRRGSIHIILGPMYSGKTSRVCEKLKFYSSGKIPKKCILVTNKKASEGSSPPQDANFKRLEHFTLGEVASQLKNFDVIAIDEAQFFLDIVETCENLANEGKIVLVAALDGTFEREVFGEVLKLIPKAETVEKLRSKCHFCGKKASFSFRFSNETDLIVIGKRFYQAACRACHLLEVQKKKHSSEGNSNNPPTDQQSNSNSDNAEETKEADISDKAEEILNEGQQLIYGETSLGDQKAKNKEECEPDEIKSLTFYKSQDLD